MIQNHYKRWAISLSLFAASFSWGIGRSGDGKSVNSDKLMFSVPVPEEYVLTKSFKSSVLSIFYRTYIPSRGFTEQFLNFLPLEETYPELLGLNREESEEKLNELGGQKLEITGTCFVVYTFESKNLSYVVLKWNDNLGVTIMGPRDQKTRKSFDYMLPKFESPEQGCQWK
jgi:hypothetical protein